MLIHKGEILRDVVYRWCQENEVSLRSLSKKLGQNVSTTYRHFENKELPVHTILKYAKVIGYSFSKEFPEVADTYQIISDTEPDAPYGIGQLSIQECLKERDAWKEKYFKLLEKHNELLMEWLQERQKQ